MKTVARHYRTSKVIRLETSGSKIDSIAEIDSNSEDIPWIAPGLVDIQINGGGGIDFNRPLKNKEAWIQATQNLFNHGCTHFLATLITNTRENYREILETLEPQRQTNPRNCIGYHFEGPFLNPAPGYKAAHNEKWMIPPQTELLDEWQKLTHDSVKLVTLAPEIDLEAALTFIRYASEKKIKLSCGHSALMGDNLTKAIEAGIEAWTHLGNAVPNPTDKFSNVIFHALAQKNLLASLIPDSQHIPPHVFRVLARYLGERLLLTTDEMAGAGAPPGRYTLCQHEIEIGDDHLARIPGRSNFAGATLMPFEGVFKAAEMADLPWQEMWDAFSTRPSRWLGFDHELRKDNEASFCLFQIKPNPSLMQTYHGGEKVFSS